MGLAICNGSIDNQSTCKGYATMSTYKTNIIIWSNIGNTPLTNRTGSYCDELVNMWVDCADPVEAKTKALEIKQQTSHAYSCYFIMPDYPNNNTKSDFCHYG